MLEKALPLKIRQAINEDIPFIFNSWLKNFKEAGLISRKVPPPIFFQNHHKLLQKIAKRASIFVACDQDDESHIYGYIAGEVIDSVLVIHYIYVKHDFRKLGIARELLNCFNHDATTAACCTHMTKAGERVAQKFNLVYHPYLVMIDYNVADE